MVLTGKVAIVTGGASGIGEETCTQFANAGAKIAIADINADRGQSVVQALESSGGQAILLHVDIRDRKRVDKAVETALGTFGAIDILVNCAGFNEFRMPEEVTQDYWEELRSVNLDGTFHFCHAVMPQMMKQQSGKVINIGSVGAVLGYPMAIPYIASKHGVVGLTRALAVDLGPYGINVNCICPGPIWTPLFEEQTDKAFQEGILRRTPLGRLGKPADIAAAALFLASGSSDWITGAILPVDGGIVTSVRAKHAG